MGEESQQMQTNVFIKFHFMKLLLLSIFVHVEIPLSHKLLG